MERVLQRVVLFFVVRFVQVNIGSLLHAAVPCVEDEKAEFLQVVLLCRLVCQFFEPLLRLFHLFPGDVMLDFNVLIWHKQVFDKHLPERLTVVVGRGDVGEILFSFLLAPLVVILVANDQRKSFNRHHICLFTLEMLRRVVVFAK